MKASLVKLVDVILKKLQETPDNPPSEKGLRVWLLGQGYKKGEIDAAINLVRPRVLDPQAVEGGAPRLAFRTFSLYEEYKLTKEARDALVRLEYYGLIDAYEREMILDRLGTVDGVVDLDGLDYLVSWVVCGMRDVETQQTIFNVMDGQPETFH